MVLIKLRDVDECGAIFLLLTRLPSTSGRRAQKIKRVQRNRYVAPSTSTDKSRERNKNQQRCLAIYRLCKQVSSNYTHSTPFASSTRFCSNSRSTSKSITSSSYYRRYQLHLCCSRSDSLNCSSKRTIYCTYITLST